MWNDLDIVIRGAAYILGLDRAHGRPLLGISHSPQPAQDSITYAELTMGSQPGALTAVKLPRESPPISR